MKCGACQRDCRTTKLANVATEDGGMRRARVCGKCFDGALHIVTHVVTVKKGVDETTAKRRDAKDATKNAAKKLRKLARVYDSTLSPDVDTNIENGGRAAGLDQAADILEAGDF